VGGNGSRGGGTVAFVEECLVGAQRSLPAVCLAVARLQTLFGLPHLLQLALDVLELRPPRRLHHRVHLRSRGAAAHARHLAGGAQMRGARALRAGAETARFRDRARGATWPRRSGGSRSGAASEEGAANCDDDAGPRRDSPPSLAARAVAGSRRLATAGAATGAGVCGAVLSAAPGGAVPGGRRDAAAAGPVSIHLERAATKSPWRTHLREGRGVSD